ncbi:MAG TPA: MFS transporter [Acidimicrobiia bacterium]|nr:MFS transporter [Acidimicrobiia bacterium]
MWPVLRDRQFKRLLVGQSLSSFGDSAMYLALGIWTKDLTGSNAAAGAVFLAQGIPSLLAPFAGHVADRVPSRRILLLATNAAMGVAVLPLLVVRSADQLWVIYGFSAFYGLASEFGAAAQAALVKDMLPAGDLVSSNAAFQTIAQGSRMVSPLVGAGLYAWAGGGGLAVFDAATFVAAIIAIATIHVNESPAGREPFMPFRIELLAGFAHIRRTRTLHRIVTGSVTALLVLGFYESVTFAVLDALHRPASFFGVLMSVQAAGSILGGLVVVRLIDCLSEIRVLAIALVAWAIASLAYTVAALPVACAALFVFGSAVTLHAVARGTAVQRHTPPRLVGRTVASASTLTKGAQTLSIGIGAVLIDRVDYRMLLLVAAITLIVTALEVFRNDAHVA